MSEAAEVRGVRVVNEQFTRSRQDGEDGKRAQHAFYTQNGRVPDGFSNIYTWRNQGVAPQLEPEFDGAAQEIYGGLDPKTVFFPTAQQQNYPEAPADELKAVADALNYHGQRSLEAARWGFKLRNVLWLGVVGRNNHALVDAGRVTNKEVAVTEDNHGSFARAAGTDIAVVSPGGKYEKSFTLAMAAADCLAIPVVDARTEAFGFAHAGWAGTSLNTSGRTAELLHTAYSSNSKDLTAYLGEGVCGACFTVDETIIDEFIQNFSRTEVDEVIAQYPDALKEVETEKGKRYSIDLYAFNKYLLTGRVGEILVAANCTARKEEVCMSLKGKPVPAEKDQKFFSHERATGKTVGWKMANGEMLQLLTDYLGTPRNLTAITRH